MTPEQKEAPTGWRYEVQYGPEGETLYAWLYEGKRMVATMRTEDAIRICAALAASQPAPVSDDEAARKLHASPDFYGSLEDARTAIQGEAESQPAPAATISDETLHHGPFPPARQEKT